MRAMTMDVKRRMISFLATRRLLGVHVPGYPSETLGRAFLFSVSAQLTNLYKTRI